MMAAVNAAEIALRMVKPGAEVSKSFYNNMCNLYICIHFTDGEYFHVMIKNIFTLCFSSVINYTAVA
jgi:hypothetical protein